MQFVTELRTPAARCRYATTGGHELILDRFVAALTNERIREQLFLQTDNLTLGEALALAQNYERATAESHRVGNQKYSTSTSSVQARGQRR